MAFGSELGKVEISGFGHLDTPWSVVFDCEEDLGDPLGVRDDATGSCWWGKKSKYDVLVRFYSVS